MRRGLRHKGWHNYEVLSVLLAVMVVVVIISAAGYTAQAAIQAQARPELVIQTGHTSLVNSVAFSPDGRTVASGGGDNSIKLWDVESGRQIKSLIGHTSYILSVAFSPDGKFIASGGFDNTVRLWDPQTGTLVRTYEGQRSPKEIGSPSSTCLVNFINQIRSDRILPRTANSQSRVRRLNSSCWANLRRGEGLDSFDEVSESAPTARKPNGTTDQSGVESLENVAKRTVKSLQNKEVAV